MTKKLLILVVLLSSSTLAFSQSVDTAWVRRYNGPGNDYDRAHGIAVDGSGNVYVTGESYSSVSSRDYATIKYYPDGDTAWLRRYNGSGNYDDCAYGIAVDCSGNIYVAGYSYGSGTYDDYLTIKYDSSGNQLWARRYNGSANGYDRVFALSIDASCNVYVTGVSPGSGTNNDYVTIKYDPDGTQLWAKRYNGPGNGEDWAYAIAIEGSGEVCVTGESDGGGTDRDYATIKYHPDGDTAWVRRYNGPADGWDKARAVAVDDSGNVYVTGESPGETCYDYATIKYYPDGDTAWVRRYNGLGSSHDEANAIAVGDSGNVYVTGASGTYPNFDYATIRYDNSGNELWVERYSELGSEYNGASALALDGCGNVYVTGRSHGSSGVADYATLKYDQAGDRLWLKRYNGSGNGYDWPFAIAVDGSQNVYVTGYSWGSGTGNDYATIKYVHLPFLCGDVNRDGEVDIADVMYLINYLFMSGSTPDPIQAGDVNRDGVVDIADVMYLINYLFIGGSPPCEP